MRMGFKGKTAKTETFFRDFGKEVAVDLEVTIFWADTCESHGTGQEG